MRLFPKPTTHLVFAVAAVGVIAFVLAVFVPPLRKISYKTPKPIKKQVVIKQTQPKPAPVSKPAPRPTPKPVQVAVVQPKPQPSPAPKPVIKPVPSSSVSNLSSTSSGSSTSSSTSTSSSSGGSGSTGTTTTTTTSSNPAPDYTSSNWSGYLDSGAKYTAISGSWQQPAATGNGSTTSADATWIGIGGVTTSDLIQIGTDDTVSASGAVTIAAFYELLPNSAININSLNIAAGDTINASITETSTNEWTITISDATKSQTFTMNISYTSANSSAEWIEEDPEDTSGNLLPFDNYGTVNFSQALTTANGTSLDLTQAGGQSIAMVNSSNQVISSPSAIGSDGASFTMTRENP